MIENVEDLRPELQLQALGQRYVLSKSHIDLPGTRSPGHVARGIAKSSRRRDGKRRRINPFRNRLSSRRDERHTGYEVRSLIVGISVGNISGVAIDGDVDGKSCACIDNRVKFPRPQNASQDSGLTQIILSWPERQFVNHVRGQIMTHVERTVSTLAGLTCHILR